MRRQLFIFTLITLFVFSIPNSVLASSYNPETVFDYADLLTTEEEDALRNLSKEYEEYNMSAIFLTTADAEGKTSMTYSDDFYDNNNFKPDGVLFMIDMDNREVYVNTVGAGITIISDYQVERILDAGYTYVGNEEYFECLRGMSNYTYRLIENHEENPGGYDTQYYEEYQQESQETVSELQWSKPAEIILTVISGCLPAPIIVIIVLITKHKKANRLVSAENYMGSDFRVKSKNVAYMGCRHEVLRGYYRQQNHNSSGGGGGGSSHRSAGGVSHGGGGRKF